MPMAGAAGWRLQLRTKVCAEAVGGDFSVGTKQSSDLPSDRNCQKMFPKASGLGGFQRIARLDGGAPRRGFEVVAGRRIDDGAR
jgi:hypothetical protein